MNANVVRACLRPESAWRRAVWRTPALAVLSWGLCQPLSAARAESVELQICFDYACARSAPARFDAFWLRDLGGRLEQARDGAAERALIAQSIADFYREAGRQTPVWRDRGGNQFDDTASAGAMDCLDHTANTTAFLRLMERGGMLRFHHVGEPLQRLKLVFGEHWGARIIERANGAQYAVDSWFFDPGTPAVIMPAARWRNWDVPTLDVPTRDAPTRDAPSTAGAVPTAANAAPAATGGVPP